MARFRKKPVVIEAVQYRDEMRTKDQLPEGVVIAYCSGDEFVPEGDHPTIHTLEGDHIVRHLDWVITGVAGEFYPCKPGIFKITYEPVEE